MFNFRKAETGRIETIKHTDESSVYRDKYGLLRWRNTEELLPNRIRIFVTERDSVEGLVWNEEDMKTLHGAVMPSKPIAYCNHKYVYRDGHKMRAPHDKVKIVKIDGHEFPVSYGGFEALHMSVQEQVGLILRNAPDFFLCPLLKSSEDSQIIHCIASSGIPVVVVASALNTDELQPLLQPLSEDFTVELCWLNDGI